MGIVKDRGRYYWVKRVPKRYLGLVKGVDGQPVKQVRQALHTDSETEAKAKASQIEAVRLAEWEAIRAGDTESARKHYEAAKELAQARGFAYRTMNEIAAGEMRDLVERVLSLAEGGQLTASPEATAAVLGAVPEVMPLLNEVKEEYYELTKTRHLKKTEAQKHKWPLPRERAVRNFLTVTNGTHANGDPIDMPVNQITSDHTVKFRNWWSVRVEKGLAISSANKDFGHLSEMINTWARLTKTEMLNPFQNMRLEGKDEGTVPGFTRTWVKDKLLAPGNLDGLNDEARDVLLMMINTGLRPSEITDAPLEDFHTAANIPFFSVTATGRQLKVAHTARDIPLLGVSLEAAKRIVARGGPDRYRQKAGSWSAAVNKYLTENGLRETPDHTAYSLRHYIENALLAAGVDDRIRADILGHKYKRPKYGDGGALAGRAGALEKIAL